MNGRIADAVNNSADYVAQLCAMHDVVLQRKLRIVRELMQLAFQQRKSDSLELLQLWEEQIINARYMRNEEDHQPTKPRKKAVTQRLEVMEPPVSKDETESSAFIEDSDKNSTVKQLALF